MSGSFRWERGRTMIQSPYIHPHIKRRRVHRNRNWTYLGFVRRHPCCACGSERWVEAAHTGPRGLGQKSDDLQCVPLCAKCHRIESRCLHLVGPGVFQLERSVCFTVIVLRLNAEFEAQLSG